MRCNTRVALVFCCLTAKIGTAGERPLLARSGRLWHRSPYATGRVGGYPWTLVAAKEYAISRFTGHRPLSGIVRRFRRESSRTGSLIITFYCDAILPRGGSVWLGTFLRWLNRSPAYLVP